MTPWQYFFDPVLRAPTIGCMLMCFSAALVGVIAFLRKQSLVGESLSHAAYPGVIIGVLVASLFSYDERNVLEVSLVVMVSAFLTALLGVWVIQLMERHLRVSSDAALCFVLSSFFGVGLTLASSVQFSHTSLYKQSLTYLFGQAATMTDLHIAIYSAMAFVVLLVVLLFYKEIQVIAFDGDFARVVGVRTKLVNTVVFSLITLTVVVGIRSVGVVLMSAMVIAPAAAARQLTNRLWMMFFLAAIFGVVSGFFGNYLSVEITGLLAKQMPQARLNLPTGPMIVLVATTICLFALLFAPKRGMVPRAWRIALFRYQRACENVLKTVWRISPEGNVTLQGVRRYQHASLFYLYWIYFTLRWQGWLEKSLWGSCRLTHDGRIRAARIVRLHRLWEVYLVEYLDIGVERVHRSAEEMEHIITPALEKELTLLLHDPKEDPHKQPIPPREVD